MTLTKIPRSIRPQSGAQLWSVGRCSDTVLTELYKMGTSGAQLVDLRARADTGSGSDARVFYSRLYQYGAGGGEVVRAYAHAMNAATATGGTLNGIHASMNVAATYAINGAGNAIRATLEAEAATRTLGGTCAAIQLDSYIGANNTVPTSWSFIRLSKAGSVDLATFLNISDDQCLKGNGTLGAITSGDALTVKGPAGQTWYIPLVAAG
jgi:hypothetical protein